MKIVDISDEIFRELAEPEDVSIASISFWLRTNVNKLNAYIGTNYVVDETTLEIVDENRTEIVTNDVAVFKKIYIIQYYEREIRKHLGAAAVGSVMSVTSDGATVRTVDRNTISKTFLDLKKTEQEELKNLLNGYKRNKYTPLHVTGDDLPSTDLV